MTAPRLSDDCVYYILKSLQESYSYSTLYNCLLVNRSWCKATIPLLYADPFHCKYRRSIMPILILCFSKSEILQLRYQLRLLNIHFMINDKHKPLFEYLKYIESFSDVIFDSTIAHWLNLPFSRVNSFTPLFHQPILRQCIKLKKLGITLYSLNNRSCQNYNIKTNLSNLNKLRIRCISNEVSHEFLSNIEKNCFDLSKLEISLNYSVNIVKEKFCPIIQQQNKLKVFELIYCNSRFINDIYLSLGAQKYSLVYITFRDINFGNISFRNFTNLYNLKCLRFTECKGLSLDQCEVLKYASFELVGLYSSSNHNFIIPSVVKYLGKSLKELILTEPIKDPSIIEIVSIYCPNLITLEIKIKQSTDLSVFTHFKNLKIRKLNIVDHFDDYSYQVLKNLGNNLSISIREVSLRFYRPSKILKLRRFLENCHEYLEIINLNFLFELEFFEIILDYAERSNNLRLLCVGESKKVLNNRELSLLNQILAKGVKIGVYATGKYLYNEYDII